MAPSWWHYGTEVALWWHYGGRALVLKMSGTQVTATLLDHWLPPFALGAYPWMVKICYEYHFDFFDLASILDRVLVLVLDLVVSVISLQVTAML